MGTQKETKNRIEIMCHPDEGIINIRELAKLLEGEGSFSVSNRNDVVISLAMQDKDTIVWAARFMCPPSVIHRPSKTENVSDMWHIAITGKQAMFLAMILYPWMSERRRQQIQVMWNVYRQRPGHGKKGEENPRSKLTWENVDYIRKNPDALSQVELATKFGVTPTAIRKVQKSVTWLN